jgi:hypothetical protein
MKIYHFWLVQPVTEEGWGFNITERAIVNAISIRPLAE